MTFMLNFLSFYVIDHQHINSIIPHVMSHHLIPDIIIIMITEYAQLMDEQKRVAVFDC